MTKLWKLRARENKVTRIAANHSRQEPPSVTKGTQNMPPQLSHRDRKTKSVCN